LRELDRLEAGTGKGKGRAVIGRCGALLQVPALTPKALAARLEVAPKTGTTLLRELQAKEVVSGQGAVTGRGSFRAFAI